ncbi:MAG: hypothetical protein HY660_14020, partial [Armatimonadetes bacterium]|nr:hypothetical protein [Armatimonadota bacterium]
MDESSKLRNEEESLLAQPVTRREMLRTAAALGAASMLARPLHTYAQSTGAKGGKVTAAMYVDITTLDPAATVYIPGILILKSVVE